MTRLSRRSAGVRCAAGGLLTAILIAAATRLPAQTADEPDFAAMRQRLEARIAARPNDSTSWRLLGRLHLKAEDRAAAHEAFRRAVELDPDSAAAHFDLGRVLLDAGRQQPASVHLALAVNLAPDSQYAREARDLLAGLPVPDDADIVQAGFEIRRFDGSDRFDESDLKRALPVGMPRPYTLWLETGALYNTNVALAPTSRDLFPGTRATFQGFLSPQIEYRLLDTDDWRAGPAFFGYFSLNEGNFRHLNLQSYQPGVFVERSIDRPEYLLIPRVQYDFTHDEFDGRTFGNRHAVTTSALALWNDGDASFVYWTIDHTDFADDGVFPRGTSRDGWTNTVGASHRWLLGRPEIRSIRAGIDLQRADTRGTDFRYNGVSLYADAEFPVAERLDLILEGGWGYRDYFDFELRPSRNEHIWRGGARLRRRVTDHWSVSAVFHYDRFDSKNRLFDAERTMTGVVTTFEY